MDKTEQLKAKRKLAEKNLKANTGNVSDFSEMDFREMVHELQIHQVELEMQNDELKRTQTTLEEVKDNFEDLYLSAPVGYLTLGSKREVLEENIMALKLLNPPKGTLIGEDVLCFIAPSDQATVMQAFKVPGTDKSLHNIKVHNQSHEIQFIDLKIMMDPAALKSERYCKVALIDCSERNRMQGELNTNKEEIKRQLKKLNKKNAALNELLGQIEIEKIRIYESVTINAEKLLLPLVKRIRNSTKRVNSKTLDLLELNVSQIASQFGLKISKELGALSNKEIEVSKMIRSGFSSKDISNSFNVSIKTVETHRRNIRKKLGIKNSKVNLATYLNSI
ncbi:MAG: hypothetical protein HN472_01165 [Nitrospina sp.]|jgi:DNA-binding CsgD family transcriptional regulator|nr:hypothetical protein [Nitrospina sp.]MBT3508137.1 hypothetical protein [Nitrospina sp.]MBT3876281.1 hypothetical protein [Nitrospina sp.]MBT4050003.1 hypothetical protein [Nitrospina sp.]MBT4556597.1 hypothetical protein [Nitrospina sp.]